MKPKPASRKARRESPAGEIERRKREHLRLAASGGVESLGGPGWKDVHLVHHALPRTDLHAVDLGVQFLGHRLRVPLVIAAMTGGHKQAYEVNGRLAAAAERHGIAMGLGSQRAALKEPALARTYSVAREMAPTSLLIANVGAPQLVEQKSGRPMAAEQLREAVEMVGAQALAIHFNFLEESVQTEGDRRARGLREALAAAVAAVSVPLIAKETGSGLSRGAAIELRALGFSALDVGGLGGTSFAAIEAERAAARGDGRGQQLGDVFRGWGIPTAVSVVGARAAGLPLVATGGIRSGLDAAKAIALGADLVGVARPLLEAALESPAKIDDWIHLFVEELRVAVWLAGGTRLSDLRSAPLVITGETRTWLDDMEFEFSAGRHSDVNAS